jgi:hypothetical protein
MSFIPCWCTNATFFVNCNPMNNCDISLDLSKKYSGVESHMRTTGRLLWRANSNIKR